MIVAGTGHRELRDRDWTAAVIEGALNHLGASRVYVGMASGFDLLLAKIAWHMDIPFICAVPWKGHVPRRADTYDYYRALELAEKVHYVVPVDDFPGNWVYQKRNEFMVCKADIVLAMYEETGRGGTHNCIEYAKKVNKPVWSMNPATKEVRTFEAVQE